MPYVRVDIDLDDIDTDDLVEEMVRRIKYAKLSDDELSDLRNALSRVNVEPIGKNATLTDVMLQEAFAEAKRRLPFTELQNRLTA